MSSLEKYNIIKSDEETPDGISEKTFGYVEGKKVLIKTDYRPTEILAEYFAYKLGEALEIPVNKVKLIDCGTLLGLKNNLCSVHWWEECFIDSADYVGIEEQKDLDMMKFFDAIIGNDDRHHHNYGFIDDCIFLIDHGLSYPWKSFYSENINDLHQTWHKVPEITNKFLSLTEDNFRKMLELPDDLEHNIPDGKFNKIVERMFEAQDILKEAIANANAA
jgi:hypothetical protein